MNFLESNIRSLRFSIMTAELTCTFCTPASVSFSLKQGSSRGWVDVHYPCEGHIKAQIRGALPDGFLEGSKVRQFVTDLLRHLRIKEDETYEATFFKPTRVVELGKSKNREVTTDRIEIERKFNPLD